MPALRCAAALLCVLAAAAPASSPAESVAAAPPGAPALRGCTSSGRGFLRARLRGALNLDIDWHDAEMQCDGGPRPDGLGLRVTLAGPLRTDGRRLRFVFGIDGASEGRSVRARPTNVTLLLEGEQRVFATRGAGLCTTDELLTSRVGALGGPRRSWQIRARGFCTGPVTAVGGSERVVLSRFDFLAEVTFDDDVAARPEPAAPDGARRVGSARRRAVARAVDVSTRHPADPHG